MAARASGVWLATKAMRLKDEAGEFIVGSCQSCLRKAFVRIAFRRSFIRYGRVLSRRGSPGSVLDLRRRSEFRNLEAPPILTWRQSCGPFEEAAEEGGIFVADAPRDLIRGFVGALETALGVLDAQPLHVVDGRVSRRVGEAPLEGSLGEPRAADHGLDRTGGGETRREPVQRRGDQGVAVMARSFDDDIGRKAVVMPLQR